MEEDENERRRRQIQQQQQKLRGLAFKHAAICSQRSKDDWKSAFLWITFEHNTTQHHHSHWVELYGAKLFIMESFLAQPVFHPTISFSQWFRSCSFHQCYSFPFIDFISSFSCSTLSVISKYSYLSISFQSMPKHYSNIFIKRKKTCRKRAREIEEGERLQFLSVLSHRYFPENETT